MSAKHTAAPWHVGGSHGRIIYDKAGVPVADATVYHGAASALERCTANAARIVACVNACEGLDDERLRLIGKPITVTVEGNKPVYLFHGDSLNLSPVLEYAKAIDQRNQLIRAMRAILDNDLACDCLVRSWYGEGHHSQCPHAIAELAITQATGA